MKRYFKTEDYIVFGISFFCIIWIFLYKLFLIDKDPIFYNADRYADITYTVFSSIVAAGLFYFVTVFIPKYFLIKNMKKQLVNYIEGVEKISNALITHINIDGTTKMYSLEVFTERIINRDKSVKKDFVDFFVQFETIDTSEIKKAFLDAVIGQMQLIDSITTNYSNLLPLDIVRDIVDLKNLNFYLIKVEPAKSLGEKSLYDYYYSMFSKILIICYDLKKLYNLKNENIQ